MLRSYLEAIVLHCLVKMNGERTIYSVFHILKGKKSSQPIQDSHLFGISHYFRTLPALTREQMHQMMLYFEMCRFIEIRDADKGTYTLTNKGQLTVQQYLLEKPLPIHLSGFQYHMIAGPFWRRFSLLFQVLSNAINGNQKYYTIQRNVTTQQWVKQFLSRSGNVRILSTHLFDELSAILEQLPDRQADIFVSKLSGYERIGLSNKQLAEAFETDEYEIYFSFLDTLHFVLTTAREQRDANKLLAYIGNDLFEQCHSPVTQSSLATLEYYTNGLDLEEIARVRNLKRSTIEDHFVEIAIHHPDFDISPFLNDELFAKIINIVSQVNTKQLKFIKESLQEEVSYFQIRLALAKGGMR
ncbi:MAG: helix-turn-helix domain-containing protein [Bacillus sp. (in: firmicutes)]